MASGSAAVSHRGPTCSQLCMSLLQACVPILVARAWAGLQCCHAPLSSIQTSLQPLSLHSRPRSWHPLYGPMTHMVSRVLSATIPHSQWQRALTGRHDVMLPTQKTQSKQGAHCDDYLGELWLWHPYGAGVGCQSCRAIIRCVTGCLLQTTIAAFGCACFVDTLQQIGPA